MKTMSFILAFSFFVTAAWAQKTVSQKKFKEDNMRVFARFVKFYNAMQSDSLQSLFTDDHSWTPASIMQDHQELGRIVSFKYIGPFNDDIDVDGNIMAYFKVYFDRPTQFTPVGGFDAHNFNGKKVHAAAIGLDKNGKISGRRFVTWSEKTDSLLKHY